MTQPYAPGTNPARWRALTVCLVAGFMTLLDVSIVNVALPSMQAGLDASPSQLSWVVSGYALTFGLVLVPAGKLGDTFGTKSMFLAGLALFTLVSLICGLSQSAVWLVCARLAQGAAGGLLNPQVIGMIQRLFVGRERGTAFGLYSAAIGVSTAIGPMVGGLLIQAAGFTHGWRWIFLVNLPIGVIALVLGVRLLPRTEPRGSHRLDVLGVALLGGGVAAIVLPLIEAEQAGGSVNWYLLGVGAALLACFVAWELFYRRRGNEPLVNLGLLRRRSYAVGITIGLCYFAGFTGIFFVLSVYFQNGLGYTALQAGAAGLPFAIGSAVSSALAGRVVYRFGRSMLVLGMIAVGVGLAATALLIRYDSSPMVWLVILGPLLLAGVGGGMVIGPNQTFTLEEVPTAEGGSAAGVLQTSQRVGSSFGLAVAGSLFFGGLASSGGDFPNSASRGLFGSTALVGVALAAGIVGLVLTRGGREAKPEREQPAPGGALSGRLCDGGDSPIADATLTVTTAAGEQAARARTDAAGHYRVTIGDPGQYLLVARASGHEPRAQWFTIVDGTVTLDLHLDTGVGT